MITVAILAAVLLAGAGCATSWYQGTRTAGVVGAAIACAVVASAFVFGPGPGHRSGIAVAVDDSCDSAQVNATIAGAIRAALAKGVDGDAAVTLGWFADNARSSRRVILDLTDAPPTSVQNDDVAFANWKAPRAQEAEQAMTMLKTKPCRRIGTSIVGAAEAANDELLQAGVTGRREIVLVTNLIEFSSALRIHVSSFGPKDVSAAVQAISDLPVTLRPRLGPSAEVRVLFVPIARNTRTDEQYPLKETAAVALKTWATTVFRSVLHAGSVRIELLPAA